MARQDAIKVEGAVVEVLPNRTCRVELPNGHRLLAYAPAKARASLGRLAPGDRVELELSPYDLSQGRLILQDRTTL